MGLALRISNLQNDAFDEKTLPTKVCSGCDPDVPGHVERKKCKTCRGTGQEPLSFAIAFAEVVESKREEDKPRKSGFWDNGDVEYDDDENNDGDLEY